MNPDYLIRKYPRTPHLEGSRLHPGDEDLRQVPFSAIAGRHLVVEEKINGANSGISFDEDGNLLLQSRGKQPRKRRRRAGSEATGISIEKETMQNDNDDIAGHFRPGSAA